MRCTRAACRCRYASTRRDGHLIARSVNSAGSRSPTTRSPPLIMHAVLAAKDDRFFQHPGVDYQGVARAVLVAALSGRAAAQGGGTITMQLARNTVLTSERTLRRKLKEVFLALRLERDFTKQEILTLYLNRIFLGQRAYGVGAAAEVYFDKQARDLTLAEAALLAGLPRAPSHDNPVASVERARERRSYVLRRMLELGKIDQAAHDAANSVPVSSRMHGPIIELRGSLCRRDGALRNGAPARSGRPVRWLLRLHDGGQPPATGRKRRGVARDPRVRPAPRLSRPARATGPRDARTTRRAGAGVPTSSGSWQPARRRSSRRCGAQRRWSRRGGARITLDWDAMSWARPALDPLKDAMGPAPKIRAGRPGAGDVVYLEPLPEGRFRLAQIPAVAGALVALDPNDGAIVVAGRRFRLRRQQVQPRDAGTAAAGLRLQAVPVFGRARARLHAGDAGQRRADRAAGRRRRRGRRGVAAAEHHAQVLWPDAGPRRTRAFAQPGVDPPVARHRHRVRDPAHRGIRLQPGCPARQPDPGTWYGAGDAARDGARVRGLREWRRAGHALLHRLGA